MADINTNPLHCMSADERYTWSTSFLTNGTSNPLVTTPSTVSRAAITRTGVGTYLVTFTDRHLNAACILGQVYLGTPGDLKFNKGTFTPGALGSGSTLTFSLTTTAGVATDAAAAVGNEVHLLVIFRKRLING